MQSYSRVSNMLASATLASAYTCVSKRARARRVGVRGSLARKKARTNKGHGRHHIPPARDNGGHKPVQALWVGVKAIRFHRQSEAEPIKNRAGCCTKDMTKAPVTVVAQALASVSAKMAVSKSKHLYFFN